MSIILVLQHRFAHPADEVFALSVDTARFPQTFAGYGPIPALRRIVLDGPLATGSGREVHSCDGSVLRERRAAAAQLHAAGHAAMSAAHGCTAAGNPGRLDRTSQNGSWRGRRDAVRMRAADGMAAKAQPPRRRADMREQLASG